MLWFLLPLLAGFAFNSASAFTTFFSARLGERGGRLMCIVLRDVLGIPLWAAGYGVAVITDSPRLFVTGWHTYALSGLLILGGSAIIIAGMVSLGWKAAAPSVNDSLVSTGLYAHIRHPLYSGMLLQLFGLAIWHPQLSMLVACFIGILWVLLQSRLEEIDLLQRIPVYTEYVQRVPPFVPRLRGLR